MTTVVYEPPRDQHFFCEVPPGWVRRGTVVKCPECERTWVATVPRYKVWSSEWRPERKRERRRREQSETLP